MVKPLKIFFLGTISEAEVKTWHGPSHILKVSKVSINDDPVMTLTYFTARSNLFKITYCANIRPCIDVSSEHSKDH